MTIPAARCLDYGAGTAVPQTFERTQILAAQGHESDFVQMLMPLVAAVRNMGWRLSALKGL